jgi:EmrB/QacA subfamily drug resistance transporter
MSVVADPVAPTAVTPTRSRLDARSRLILFLLLGSQFMLAIDFSILNVALPEIGAGLGFGTADLAWIATAFALPAAGFTLLFGRIADLFGRRRLFFAGLALLVGASLLGGLAQDPATLLVARVLQGLAAAMAIPAALSLLTTVFAEGPLRERALGLNGALMSSGFTVGALVGGLLTGVLDWRWAFLLNVPVGLAILAVGPAVLPAGRPTHRPTLDLPGAVTVTAGLLALCFGLITASHHGWSDPVVLISLPVAAALLAAFWMIELRSPAPLASVRILARRTVKWGNFGGLLVFSMESSVVYLMTLYVQKVLGYSALVTGLVFGVPGIAAVLGGVFGPRLIDRYGRRGVLVGGLVVQALANAALIGLGHSRSGVLVVPAVLLAGFFGHVAAIVAYTVTATSGLPDSEQGLATGLATLTQQVALTVGIPLLTTVMGTGALLGGIHRALAVDVAVTLAGAALIWRGLRNER